MLVSEHNVAPGLQLSAPPRMPRHIPIIIPIVNDRPVGPCADQLSHNRIHRFSEKNQSMRGGWIPCGKGQPSGDLQRKVLGTPNHQSMALVASDAAIPRPQCSC